MSTDEIKDLRARIDRVEGYLTSPEGVLPRLAEIHAMAKAQGERLERGDRAFDAVRTNVAALETGGNRAIRLPECNRNHDAAATWLRTLVPPFIAATLTLVGALLLK